MLETLIPSKTRLRLLIKFFVNEANRAHMRGLAGEFNESTNAIRKELNHLSDAGYLERQSLGNRIDYRANIQHPLFGSLQQIVHKYLGLAEIVEKVLARMGDVHQIWIIGDYAKGVDSGTIKVVVLGNNLESDYGKQLADKLELLIGRKVELHFWLPDEIIKEPRLLMFGTS